MIRFFDDMQQNYIQKNKNPETYKDDYFTKKS